MNRQAFRNRMQQLKQYREQNPGKTYLDFKKYVDGGEIPPEQPLGTYDENLGKRTINNRLTTNFQEERDWLANFAKARAKRPEFSDQLNPDQLTKYLHRVYNSPIRVSDDGRGLPQNAAGVTRYDTSVAIPYEDTENFYKRGAAIVVDQNPANNGNNIEFSRNLESNVIHELDHATQMSTGAAATKSTGFSKRVQKVADIIGADLNNAPGDYGNQPWEVLSRRQQMFHEINADPNKKYTKDDIKSMRGYLKKYELNQFGDDKVMQLLNDVAANNTPPIVQDEIFHAADGGEVPPLKKDPPMKKPIIPDEPIPYKGTLYKDRYGKKYTEDQVEDYYQNSTDEIDRFTGNPMVRGLKPLIDLEDAANFTPVGDAISAYDVYDALKNSDLEGAGLAAMGLVPFMPMTVKQFRRTYQGITPKVKRPIPKVNKGATDKAIDSYFEQVKRYKMSANDYMSDVANESNRIFEDLNTLPYRSRAIAADKAFGTNYNGTYDILDDLYQKDYFSLPDISSDNLGSAVARMQARPEAANRFFKTGEGAGPRDFEFKVNVDRRGAPDELAAHELNHYTDYSISKSNNTNVNNPMLRALEHSLKRVEPTELDKQTKYLRSGTEQKAYMNTLRRRMLKDGTIKSIDDHVSRKLLGSYIGQLPDSDYIKKAYKQHKNINQYTKWFNSIPLLGVGAAAVYNNKQE